MKIHIFVGVIFLSTLASADPLHTPNTTGALGCEEMETLFEYSQMAEMQNLDRNEEIADIQMAFQTLCQSSHPTNTPVYYENGQLASENFDHSETSLYYPNGQLMVENPGSIDAVWFYPNGDVASEDPDEIWNLLNGFFRKTAPISAPFKNQHKVCAGSCSYVSWGIWGDEAHKKRKSCHNSGEAIDIHAITCGKVKHGPTSSRFKNYVGCMRKKFKVLFQVKDHYQHAHIQIHNCRKIKLK